MDFFGFSRIVLIFHGISINLKIYFLGKIIFFNKKRILSGKLVINMEQLY
jgi:hypothetical protein